MPKTTCTIEDCGKPERSLGYCYAHYMRNYRYGSPLYRPAPRPRAIREPAPPKPKSQPRKAREPKPRKVRTYLDLTGERFGLLRVSCRVNGRWLCVCDCGAKVITRTGDLNRGTSQTCGARWHRRREHARYTSAHQRVRHDRGPAKHQLCIDCGRPAAHWSYDHTDPAELVEDGMPYSLDVSRYDPRCVSCHNLHDLARLAG